MLVNTKTTKRSINKAGHRSRILLIIVLLLFVGAGYAQTKNDCPFCYLKDKSFAGQDLTNVNFNGADLDSADFTNAILDGANFSNASLVGARFNNARSNAIGKGPVNFSLSNCTGANFSNTSLQDAVFYYANISCTDFSGADLSKARLGPELKVYNSCPAIFKGAKLGCEFIPFVYILNLKDAILPSCLQQPVAQAAKEPAIVITDIKKPADPTQATMVTATRKSYSNRDTTSKVDTLKDPPLSGDTLFVSTQGTDNNKCGATGSPCKTIGQAVTNCGANACTIAVEYGEYTLNTPVSLKGIKLVGGFYNGQSGNYQSALLAPPGGLPAIIATGGAVTISNFIINGSTPSQLNLSSVALLAQAGSTLNLLNTNINSFKGGTGANGTPSTGGGTGGKGGEGNRGNGGSGGTSPCPNNAGGLGGNSSYFKSSNCHYIWSKVRCLQEVEVCWYNGGSGQPGSTGVSAAGSQAAAGVFYFWGTRERPSTAATGNGGTAGSCASNNANPNKNSTGAFDNGQWKTVTGDNGTAGGNGGGGGGGGCGGYCAYCGFTCNEETYNGTAGGGGGAGGCGAAGGQGANMGGASFGVVLINATLTGDTTVKITNGSGGDGGTGGPGASGGTGGGGGSAQTSNNVCNDTGGAGGSGGAGGAGGASGGGAGGNGGPSIGVALVGTSTVSNKVVFYAGKSGNPGGGGDGGKPVTGATCYGAKGNGGISATVANTHQY